MEQIACDVAIIGAGPGGYVAAIRASRLGKRVVLVEKDRLGGVCLNVGCIPTKALITTARQVESTRRAGKLGIGLTGEVAVDQPAAVKRARSVSGRMSKGVGHLMKACSVQVISGTARLTAPGKVQLQDGPLIEARAVILATGARPRPLPGIPFDGQRVITSTDAMWMERVPERLVVVGAGAIGMEFAYYYAVAGSRVTVVEALDSILPFADPEAVKAVVRAMRRRKVEMICPARVVTVQEQEEGVRVVLERGGEQTGVDADRVLVSIGVTPNTEDLWDPALEMKMDGPFVKTDGWGRTSVDGVYAIGDLAGAPLLAHAASHEGVVAAEHICGLDPEPKDEAVSPGVVYCQPQVAQVGLTEALAAENGRDVVVGKYPFLASGMAQAAGESDGFVKLVFEGDRGPLVGATIVCAEAAELISELCVAHARGLTARDLIGAIHPHPTYAEAVMEAAAQAAGEPIHLS